MGMFDFFAMAGNYEQRKVGRLDADWGFVSTCYVNDADKPYETAVEHPEYNDGNMVIVEAYDTRGDAEQGHARWVDTMTAETLPDVLRDNGRAGIAMMIDAIGDDEAWRDFPRKRAG